jgi:hypothetical protein
MEFVSGRHKYTYKLLNLFVITGYGIFIFINVSCQAPRNNPLDPLNPDFNFGSIEGTVQTINLPYNAIPDVLIAWEESSLITKTDVEGKFRLDNIPIADGILIFSKPGYKTDTLQITWRTAKRFYSRVFLNEIPVLDNFSLYSVVVNQQAELFVQASITDDDKDVESVFISSPGLSLIKELSYNLTARVYETRLTLSDLNIPDIEQTIGQDFYILARDMFQNEFTLGSSNIKRVIKNGVTGLIPANNDTISSQPFLLRWNSFTAGYTFTYMVEIFTNDALNQMVYRQEGISSDSTSCMVEQTLPAADYYWVIWVIDQFNNRCRSISAGFRIQ